MDLSWRSGWLAAAQINSNEGNRLMKTLILCACVALGSASATYVLADTLSSDTSKVGTYVKDSAITTKVKAKLAAKHMSTLAKKCLSAGGKTFSFQFRPVIGPAAPPRRRQQPIQ